MAKKLYVEVYRDGCHHGGSGKLVSEVRVKPRKVDTRATHVVFDRQHGNGPLGKAEVVVNRARALAELIGAEFIDTSDERYCCCCQRLLDSGEPSK